jgi:hypothetical protein
MLLRIVAPHFVAGCLWQKTVSEWECVKAAPIIKYMVGMSSAEAKRYLTRKAWKYEWVP